MAIPIRINPLFWLLAGIIGWINTASFERTLIWVAVIFISVIFHELGHALTALYFGQKPTVTLTGFGGVTYRAGQKLKLWKEFLITMNGPMAGFLLFGIVYVVIGQLGAQPSGIFGYALVVALWVNLFWTIINLIPVLPLDGGRLVSIVLEAIFGFRGVRVALLISILLCAVAGLLFFAYNRILPGAILFILAFENYRGWSASKAMSDHDQDSSLWQQLKGAEASMTQGDHIVAEEKFIDIRNRASSGLIHTAATQFLSDILIARGNEKEAYGILMPIKSQLAVEHRISLQKVAYNTGHYREAASIGQDLYREMPRLDVAELNASCHAVLGEVSAAVGWLECLLREGAGNLTQLLKKNDFDPIRREPLFIDFRSKRGL